MRFIAFALLALSLLAVLPGLGKRDFWPPDGARYGGVAREMYRTGDFAVPHLNDEIYGEKPPGYFWAVQVAAWFTGGVDERTSRLPSAFAAVVLVILCGVVGARATGAHAGFLSGMALLATWSFVWQGRYAQLDLLFAMFVSLGALAGFRALEKGRPHLLSFSFVWLGLAILVKGPLALLVLPLLFLWHRFAGVEKREGLRFRNAILLGVLLMLLPVVAWLVWATETHGFEYVREDLIQRNILDRARHGLAHRQNWHFYLRRLPTFWAPWILMLPLFFSKQVRNLLGEKGRRLCGFCGLWVIFFLVLQSIFPGKRSVYTFIFCAPMAILIGHGAAAASSVKALWGAKAWLAFVLFVVGLLFLVVGGFGLFLSTSEESFRLATQWLQGMFDLDFLTFWDSFRLPRGPSLLRHQLFCDLRSISFAMALTGLWSLVLLLRRRFDFSLDVLLIGLVAVFCLAFSLGTPWLNHARSRQKFAQQVLRTTAENPVAIFRHTDEGILFYLGKHLPELKGNTASVDPREPEDMRRAKQLSLAEEASRRWLKKSDSQYLIIRRSDRLALKSLTLDQDYVLIQSQRVGSRRWYDLLRSPRKEAR